MSVMSLRPHVLAPVPEETARVARAAFPKGNPYLHLRDALGTIFQDDDFTPCSRWRANRACRPWRLALVTIMQFRENLADRQAAEAVRARIDWKYLLGLELTDPGFDFSVLSEFRDRLLAGSAEELLLDKLLERCRAWAGSKPAGPAAHRLDACARRHPGAESARTRGGNPPRRPQRRGHRGAGLAARIRPLGVV